MNYHLVSVYTRAGVLAHVSSTNGDLWPGAIVEHDSFGVVIPLVRIDVKLEPTAAEAGDVLNPQSKPRSASVLFKKELEVIAGKVSYRAGEGSGGAIIDRGAASPPI